MTKDEKSLLPIHSRAEVCIRCENNSKQCCRRCRSKIYNSEHHRWECKENGDVIDFAVIGTGTVQLLYVEKRTQKKAIE